jgi:hypothetical protein
MPMRNDADKAKLQHGAHSLGRQRRRRSQGSEDQGTAMLRAISISSEPSSLISAW